VPVRDQRQGDPSGAVGGRSIHARTLIWLVGRRQ